jgi:nitroreductase
LAEKLKKIQQAMSLHDSRREKGKIIVDILEAISRRISVRSYEPAPARVDELEEVRSAGERSEALTQADMRFLLCTDALMGKEIKGLIGDYGKYIHAPHYIVLASREHEGYLTDAGFRFEQMVLEATQKGLGTCWVGLRFKESSLRSTLDLDPSWRIIVLTPIGRPAPSFSGRALRTLAGSKARKPLDQIFYWQRHNAPLPAGVMADERLIRVLEAARWAPSWMNRQPWRFILTNKEVLVYKMKQQNREGKDYHFLDCGIAMAHLYLAAKALGIGGRWDLEQFEVPGAAEAESIGRYLLTNRIG